MRKLILSITVSLDGMIARANGNIDWFLTDREFENEMFTLLKNVDAMLFGRVSYDLLADFWPTAETPNSAEPPGGFTDKARKMEFGRLMNTIPKVLFSRTRTSAAWGPVTIVNDGVGEAVAKMKQQPGKDLVAFAGAKLASTLMNLDLVDEYRLMVHPIVLGKGIPLFANLAGEHALTQIGTQAFESGVVTLRYARK